jgi:transposase-like protein
MLMYHVAGTAQGSVAKVLAAVAATASSAGRRTFKSVADGLDINHRTLRAWVREA